MRNTPISDSLHTFIEQEANDCFYYRQEWQDLIAELYGYSVIRLTTTNSSGQITGLLPVCFMQSPLTGRRLVSLPFSDHCPLLAADKTSANNLIDQALNLAQEKRVNYLELRSGSNEVLAHRSDFMEENLYVRWNMPLGADPEAMWSDLRKPVQKRIKKSRKAGVHIRIMQEPEELADYYRLHLQTRSKKHGMPTQPRRFFFDLWKTFAATGAMQVFLAEYEGHLIACMILLISGTTVRCVYSASEEDALNLAPNNLLWWEVIVWSSSHGYKLLDFGRTALQNEGLMEFKRRWGAIMEPLPYYYYPHVKGLASTPESSWKFHLLTGCWKRLPLPVAEYLGGHLYKHLG
jgi:FemAB-related protein (PEP-CTERM system-associated)